MITAGKGGEKGSEAMATLHFDKEQLADRLIRYAKVFTQSKEGVNDTPSTPCQRDLARLLTRELEEMGALGRGSG